MSIGEDGNCLDTLVDILCYEMICGTLSPETKALFAEHLEICAACRKRFSDFLGLAGIDREPEISRMVH
jgi:hypothetical protein